MSNPYPVNVILVVPGEYDRKVDVHSTEEFASIFALVEQGPWIADEISENAVDGEVYFTFCPHAEEIRDVRSPIFAPTEEALEAVYQKAREKID